MFRFLINKRKYKNQLSKKTNRLLLRIGKKMPRGLNQDKVKMGSPKTLIQKGLIKEATFVNMKSGEETDVYALTQSGMKEYKALRNK